VASLKIQLSLGSFDKWLLGKASEEENLLANSIHEVGITIDLFVAKD